MQQVSTAIDMMEERKDEQCIPSQDLYKQKESGEGVDLSLSISDFENGSEKPLNNESGNLCSYTDEELETLLNLGEFLMESALRLVKEGVVSKSQFPVLFAKSFSDPSSKEQ